MAREDGSQIPDIDKAWTAANAENAFREMAEKKYGKKVDPGFKELIKTYANDQAEKRISDYNPEIEARIDSLKQKAKELAHICQLHLEQEYGSMQKAETFLQLGNLKKLSGNENLDVVLSGNRYIFDAFNLLKSSIRSLDLGMDISNEKGNIEDAEKNVGIALQIVKEFKNDLRIQ